MQLITPDETRRSCRIIKAALKEDIRTGDITTNAVVSPRRKSYAFIISKSRGILAGIHFCAQTFSIVNENISISFPVEEGKSIKKGQRVLEIRGSTGTILKAERTALNLLGRMSGIATLTAKFVEKVKGTDTKILDTRKTMPGLRLFDKYAVRAGGGYNHRYGLDDMFLIKENHIAAAGDIAAAVQKCLDYRKRHNKDMQIVSEASSLEDSEKAAGAGADRILLDNMTPHEVHRIVKKLRGKVELEVSGGITLKNVRAYAETGVDYVSVGMLTHSASALDFSLLVI
ncbi:hypothetical protein AMJ80_08295 [bacterium SM23_31]|nr:MAG: hypothetical protein AMJ80_08295 [bacterium SM23_31]